ncbi:MAG: hypothetical protein E7108_03650 [Bacteroidales bacterium]|nr:hypothetical protein [Bacteroidales bacterium]
MRRISNSNILITIGIAVIVIPICCYLFILFSNSGVLSKMSFENILSKTRIEIPSVNCYDNAQKWLTGQYDDDYGSVFLKKDSIFFATFKEDDNPRKGYKYELINLSEIGDKLDKAAGWMAGTDELYMYPLRTFVDKDMPMKDVMNVLYKIRPYRPSVAFVLRDRDSSDYIYCHYRFGDSLETQAKYKSVRITRRLEVFKSKGEFYVLVEGDLLQGGFNGLQDFPDFFNERLSYRRGGDTLIIKQDEMTFEEFISILYAYGEVFYKYRNDYCLKAYGKPFGRLDEPRQKEARDLYPIYILIL